MGGVSGSIRSSVGVTITDDKVVVSDNNIAVLTLGGTAGAWTFKASDNNEYLALTTESNQIHSSADASLETSQWNITTDFQLVNKNFTNRYIRYNSSSPRFACYTSAQNTAVLYVKEGSAVSTKVEPGYSFSATTAEAAIGEAFTAPTFDNPNNVAVTFRSSDPAVATVDESGNVTIVAAGETTITATSEETDEFMAGSASYTLTVTDPNGPGSESNPYTVAQALEAIDALADNGYSATEVYIKGIVSGIKSIDVSQYERAQYYISDDGTETDQLLVYNGYYLEGVAFTANDQIQIGDEVVVYGKLQKYVKSGTTTPEIAANNKLVSLKRPAQPKYYVAGDWTNWQNGKVEMTKASASEYTLSGQKVSNGQQFKIVKVDADGTTTTWFGGDTQGQGGTYGIHSGWCTDIALTAGDAGSNFILKSSKESSYTFTLNVDNMTLSVTGWPEPTWYLAGSFATTDDWAEDMAEFESQGDGIYTLTKELEANTELKVVNETKDQWYSTNPAELTKENSSQGIQLSTDNGSNMKIAPAGTYTFTLDANTMTLSVTGWQIVLEGNAFVKVTSTDDLEDGAYLIVCEDATEAGGDDAVLNGNIETIDSGSNFISVVSTNNTLIPATDDNKKAVFIISNGTIQSASQGYYIGATSNSNQIATSTTDAYGNNISIDGDGNAIISADFDGSDRTLGFFDQPGGRFRYYGPKSNAKAVQLYKLTTIEPVTVKLNKYGYATMYYGNLALTVPEGVTATTYTEDVEESTTYNAGEAIPAGEAVVLKGEANTEYTFELTTTDVAPDTNNALMGLDEAGETVAPADGDYKFYMLSAKNGKVGFYYGTRCPNGEAFQTAAHKAYLVVPVAAGAKECYIFGETTGINSIQNAEFAEGSVYNLNGQRVDKNYKGVVIVNGKKLIKK